MKVLEFLFLDNFSAQNTPSWLRGALGTIVFGSAILIAFGFLGTLIFFIVGIVAPIDEALASRAEAVRNIGLILGAFIGFPFIIWRSVIAAEQSRTASESLFNNKISDASKDLNARRQKSTSNETETGSASDMIWEDDVVARCMAIDRLEGLADERPEFSLRIAKMLVSYIRGNFPCAHQEPTPDIEERVIPRIDLQRAVETLGRVNKLAREMDSGEWRLDLRYVNFDGVDFAGGYFFAADFTKSRFEWANLDNCVLMGSIFHHTLLDYSSFINSNLTGSSFSHARYCQPAETTEQPFYSANIRGVDLSSANFSAISIFGSLTDIRLTHGDIDTKLHPFEVYSIPGADDLNRAYVLNQKSSKNLLEKDLKFLQKIDSLGFTHWSPFTKKYFHSLHVKKNFMKKLGLNKWPYIENST